MISETNLSHVIQHVRNDVPQFLAQPNNSSKRFCDPQDETEERARMPALARFVFDLTGATIQNFQQLPAKNYASWLFAASIGQTSIYLDERQMISWHQQTKVPVRSQQIRSIVHELGHLQFSLRLLTGQTGTFVSPSYPVEEEKAWVYGIFFLGLLVGDYSFHCRHAPYHCDDAPKLRL